MAGGLDKDVGERTALMHVLDDERSQALIKQAHREWLAALDAIQDPIFIHDRKCRVVRSNRAYAEHAGMSVKEVIGKPYYGMFPKHDGPLPHYQQVIQHGGASEAELPLENGRIFLSRVAAVTDRDGRYVYSLSILYDITERKQMELAMRDGEERLRLAFNTAHQAWFDLNVQTGAASVSPEFPGMIGYAPAEFDASLQGWKHALHPDDRERALDALRDYLATGGSATMEYRLRTGSGEWKWVSAVGKVVGRDAQQKPLRMIGIFTDITERKQAELALITSEARFRSMFESLAEGVLLFGRDGLIQTCNPAAERILGLDRAQLIGAGMPAPGWVAWHENKAPFAIADLPVTRTLNTGESQRGITIGVEKPSGELRWLNVSSEPIFEAGTRETAAAIVSFEDISERKRSEENLIKLNHSLRTISECNQTLIFAEDERQLLLDMCWVIVETGGHLAAWVGYAQQDAGKTIRPMAQHGFQEGILEALTLSWGGSEPQCLAGRAISSGKMQISQDIGEDSCFGRWGEQMKQLGIASVIALPLKEGGEVFGSLDIYSAESNAFNEDEVRLLQELAGDLAFGIGTMRLRREQERITKQLRKELEGTVQAVSAMVEMRDPYTAGHERRVAELAVAIAKEMGLPEERVRGIHLAGTIHDVGKIQVPAEILSKPGRLNEVEYSLVRQHPQTGYEILKDIEFPWPIAQMVLQHHERLDGSGYPQGLEGDAILLDARILGVADVVEAMASHRPYRPGLGVSAALDEVRKNRGTYYDANVVDACVRLFEEKNYTLPEVWGRH
jgi:PAS domain S-box-containing protein